MALFLLLLLASPLALGLDNGLGRTPQMGWNSWNYFACNINETIIRSAADALVSTGLNHLGYEYVNIDDCWAVHDSRGPDGRLVPDPIKFPNGIDGLANYVHGLGLKLGIYTDAGTHTCGGQPGSLGFEGLDAQTFASWGVDYLKYDTCHDEGVPANIRYDRMRDALNATGRPIFYSICNWGMEGTTTWGPELGNSWRTSIDIKDFWLSMKMNFFIAAQHPEIAGPGGWNDPDMLEVGNGRMTQTEYQSHFTLWSFLKAPLIIGCDLATASAETLSILGNQGLIAINQDPLGIQGTCKLNCDVTNSLMGLKPQVWSVPLANGDTGVAVVNWDFFLKSAGHVLSLESIGVFGDWLMATNLWTGETSPTSVNMTLPEIPGHGVVAFRISALQATA